MGWWDQREIIRTRETRNYRVVYSVLPDPEDLGRDFNTADPEELAFNLAEQEALESSELIQFVAHVQVEHKATGLVLGQSCTGGCVYESVEDFDFRDMVSDAITDARETKRKLCAA